MRFLSGDDFFISGFAFFLSLLFISSGSDCLFSLGFICGCCYLMYHHPPTYSHWVALFRFFVVLFRLRESNCMARQGGWLFCVGIDSLA